MKNLARRIFSAAVDAVTPHELITKRQIISLKKDLNREILEFKNKNSTYKLDVTDKNIHIGNCQFFKWSLSICVYVTAMKINLARGALELMLRPDWMSLQKFW